MTLTSKNEKKYFYLFPLNISDLYLAPIDKKGEIHTGIKLAKKDGTKVQQCTICEQKPAM